MKHLIIPLLLAGGFLALSTMEASAVICARGVVRAGCVAAGGAAVVARRPVARAVVVAIDVAADVRRFGNPDSPKGRCTGDSFLWSGVYDGRDLPPT